MKKISFIGGDLVTIELIKIMLNAEYNVGTYGLDLADIEENQNLIKYNYLDEFINHADIIVTSMPMLDNFGNILTTFSREKIQIEKFINLLKNKTIIGSKIPENIKKEIEANGNQCIDIEKSTEFNILNSIATAEGVLQVAINETDFCINGSSVLVLGYGRIGKMISKTFKALGAKVSCEARKNSDLAWIEAYGYEAINLKDLNNNLHRFDIIINTVPYKILNLDNMMYIKKDALLIDVAVSPSGINQKDAREYGLKVKWALSLPEKVAPITYAKTIIKVLLNFYDY